MSLRNKLDPISGYWYFLISAFLIYFILFVFQPAVFFLGLKFSYGIILKILPVLFLVFALMALSNYFITPKFTARHLGRKGIKKWIFVIIGGVLSSGPIYMWYPLLADLKNKGLTHGLIACFLYNRGIKIPLLPVAVFYFGWTYVLVLSAVMVFASIIQGMTIDRLMEARA
jgi:uncharacterized membrane protein YraQ (UPF0718 family)